VTQESVLAYEVGVKSSLLDHRLEVTAAAFYYDYHDKQLLGRQVFTPNIFGAQSALVNIPKSRIEGAEVQATLRPVTGMTLSAAATYLDTKVLGDFFNYSLIGVRTNFNSSAFPYTPKWQIVLDGEQRVPLSESLDGMFGLNASYHSATVAGFGGDPRLNIDSYWLLDLRAGVEATNGKWKAELYGRNVTNQYYWNNVSAAGDTLRRYSGMPTTYGVLVSYKF
jgi:outer membrane receptor protein involved in Fe transport